jgi:FkbM family methyltransferase
LEPFKKPSKLLIDESTGLCYREGTMDLYVIREQSQYRKFLNLIQDKVVLDIGGNIGAFAYNAFEAGAKEVVSFEPDEENARIYECQNPLYRSYKSEPKLYRIAVSDRGGTAKLYVNGLKNKGTHSLIETRGREFVMVRTMSFDYILKKHKPYALKIDIEGGEYLLDFNLIPSSVKAITVELHLNNTDKRNKGRVMLDWLRENFKELSNTNITDKNWTTLFIGER